ncbi:MAG: general secretion pathway protein GspB [Lysobacter sp.]|nr:general secretion pathway protein GspB [Lysobacter sp.]
MSLILEALRKSEAERRRGQAPDLFSELPPVVRPRVSKPTPVLWLVVAIIVLAIGAWWARGLWSPSARTDAAAVANPTEEVNRLAAQPRSATQPDAADVTPRANGSVAAQVAVIDATPSATVPAAPMTAPAQLPSITAPDNVVAQERTAPTPPIAPVRETPLPAARPATAARPVPVTTSAATSASPPTPASSTGATLQLTDLTVEQRRQLPPLRMSMHMWDEDPARRFVIIDGTRRAEGDRVGEAVVGQITADSVLLDWNGLRLRLSLR